ncbi:ATP-binding protein [Segetibacter aerophilus]|nr:ATP-binding protein [Segetibacter aerophilus]
MANKNLIHNAAHLQKDLHWLTAVLESRLTSFVQKKKEMPFAKMPAPAFHSPVSVYQQFIRSFELNDTERMILLVSLLPYVDPHLVERSLAKFGIDNRQLPDIGGIKGSSHGGLIPTGETVFFLIAGSDLQKRLECSLLFSPQHKFYTKNILKLQEISAYEPETSGVILISKDVLHMLTTATTYQPLFNSNFPARLLTTNFKYDEMVLASETEQQLEEIRTWLDHKEKLLGKWGFGNKIPDGFKCLFYGPSGTGKSLAAALIGKQNNLPVYRIDLSMVISKYIGETEKNLSRIFDAAANKKWILFFDEADALFGKRSNIQNANDRFANQEVSYLLMRMEEYEGLAILATNLKGNIDKAFLRRFQLITHFPLPDKEQRQRLWRQSFSPSTSFANDVNLQALSENFSLTGANIMNVVRYASVMALKQGNNIITSENVIMGIKKELSKESSLSGDNLNS